MSTADEMAERHGRVLAELSELGLTLARDLHARALGAEDAKTAADLGLAFHRISRSVRQTMALEARLERDRTRRDREVDALAAREAETRVQVRKVRVRSLVERMIWNEVESDEAEELVDELELRLDEEAFADDFGADPIEAHVARIRSDLGLPALASPSPRGGGGGGADAAGFRSNPHRRSSA